MNKRTKIICTLGPASATPATLEKMIQAGMNVARLNFSHGTHPQHRQLITNVRTAAKRAHQRVVILQDLQGPRMRIGVLPAKGVTIKLGDQVLLIPAGSRRATPAGYRVLPIDFPDLARQVKKGNRILIDDGLIEVKVEKADRTKRWIFAHTITGGTVTTHRGMNVPDVALTAPVITDKDKTDLRFGLQQGVDWVALSFVRSAADIAALRRLIKQHHPKVTPRIIAKIERKQAIENITEIIAAADGIMIARGDLGIELPPERVPVLQKTLIQRCRTANKPVVVATQMMESMMTNPRPTRAEISDVANAVIDHADAVMLSGETATGKYPVETVTIMANTIRKTERSPFDDVTTLPPHPHPGSEAIATAVADLVQTMQAKAVFVVTVTGRSISAISRLRPATKLIALTDNEPLIRQLLVAWGVMGYRTVVPASTAALVKKVKKIVREEQLARSGQYVLLVFGQPTQGLYTLMPILTE